MKRNYKTDLTRYSEKIAHAMVDEMRDTFGMRVEVDGGVVYHQRKMTMKEAGYLKGFGAALTQTDWDL